MNGDTPLPIEVPAAPNPPEGAVIDYTLPAAAAGEIALTITDARGSVVRRFTSTAPPASTLLANVPEYRSGPPDVLTTNRGLNASRGTCGIRARRSCRSGISAGC